MLAALGLAAVAAGAAVPPPSIYVSRLTPAEKDTGLWGSNVLVMAATPADLGITVGQPFRWRVASCPGWAPLCALPPARYPLDTMGPSA